jgi:hypothetical protein
MNAAAIVREDRVLAANRRHYAESINRHRDRSNMGGW